MRVSNVFTAAHGGLIFLGILFNLSHFYKNIGKVGNNKQKKAIKGLKGGYIIIIHSNNLVLGFHQIRMVAW